MGDGVLGRGLYEELVTATLARRLGEIGDDQFLAELHELRNAEAPDRLSRHLATVVRRVLDALPEEDRSGKGLHLVRSVLHHLALDDRAVDINDDVPLVPGRVLAALLRDCPMAHPRLSKRH